MPNHHSVAQNASNEIISMDWRRSSASQTLKTLDLPDVRAKGVDAAARGSLLSAAVVMLLQSQFLRQAWTSMTFICKSVRIPCGNSSSALRRRFPPIGANPCRASGTTIHCRYWQTPFMR